MSDSNTTLQELLNKGGEIVIPPGSYEIGTSLVVRANSWIKAYDVTLRKRGRYGALVSEQSPSQDNIRISGVNIDCMGESFCGICTFGSRNIYEDCAVFNHISPVYPGDTEQQESFGLLMDANPHPGSQNLIQRCTIRDFQGDYNGGMVIAGKAGNSGVIRGCKYIGSGRAKMPRDMDGVIGATIVQDCEWFNTALGVYTEGGVGDMIVLNCKFNGVRNASVRVNLAAAQRSLTMIGCNGSAPFVIAQNEHSLECLGLTANTFTSMEWARIYGIKNVVLASNIFPRGAVATFLKSKGHAIGNLSADGKWVLEGKIDAQLRARRIGAGVKT